MTEREIVKQFRDAAIKDSGRMIIAQDTGRRKFNPMPFDAILFFPQFGNIIMFLEFKMQDSILTDEQMNFAESCLLDRTLHFIIRCYNDKFVISILIPGRTERACNVVSNNHIFDIIGALKRYAYIESQNLAFERD